MYKKEGERRGKKNPCRVKVKVNVKAKANPSTFYVYNKGCPKRKKKKKKKKILTREEEEMVEEKDKQQPLSEESTKILGETSGVTRNTKMKKISEPK